MVIINQILTDKPSQPSQSSSSQDPPNTLTEASTRHKEPDQRGEVKSAEPLIQHQDLVERKESFECQIKRVKRKLFDDDDEDDGGEHEESLKRLCKEEMIANKKKWNFDFELEEPLQHGDWEWEKVKTAPEFYKQQVTDKHKNRSQSDKFSEEIIEKYNSAISKIEPISVVPSTAFIVTEAAVLPAAEGASSSRGADPSSNHLEDNVEYLRPRQSTTAQSSSPSTSSTSSSILSSLHTSSTASSTLPSLPLSLFTNSPSSSDSSSSGVISSRRRSAFSPVVLPTRPTIIQNKSRRSKDKRKVPKGSGHSLDKSVNRLRFMR